MTPKFDELTPEQQQTVRELQEQVASLEVQADREFSKFLATNADECYDNVLALDSEASMRAAIAYIPRAGERKVGLIEGMIDKLRVGAGKQGVAITPDWKARIDALESINEWRDSLGLPPLDRLPRGLMGDAAECTLARAIGITLGESGAGTGVKVEGNDAITWVDNEGATHRLAITGAGTVISTFDDGGFLDLLEDGELVNKLADILDPDNLDPDDYRKGHWEGTDPESPKWVPAPGDIPPRSELAQACFEIEYRLDKGTWTEDGNVLAKNNITKTDAGFALTMEEDPA